MNSTTTTTTTTTKRPSLSLYHANSKGTGSAIRFEAIPATVDSEGCIMMTIASQATIGDRRAAQPVYPRFDWENSVTVKLDFSDLTKMLQVFRGECESIEEGRGMYHRITSGINIIKLEHHVEPFLHYRFYVKLINSANRDEREASISITSAEALGVCAAIEGVMHLLVFGI